MTEKDRRLTNKSQELENTKIEVALFSFEGTNLHKNPVTIARRIHLFPCRTQKLSSFTSMILGGRPPGKVDSCRLEKPKAEMSLAKYSRIAQLAVRLSPKKSGIISRFRNVCGVKI